MRKPIIAGNWKMNKTPSETARLICNCSLLMSKIAEKNKNEE